MFEMDKFEEAWKQNRHVWESTKNLAKAMYLAGEEVQQAKVDELEQELESERAEQIKGYSKISDLRLERDELQKRVDVALKAIDSFKDYTGGDLDYTLLKIETILKEQALKGEGSGS